MILYTTRDSRDWGELKYIKEKLGILEREEAKGLFKYIYGKKLEGLDTLLNEYLESYPLDIVLCASYIKKTGDKLDDYIASYIKAKRLLPKSFIESIGYKRAKPHRIVLIKLKIDYIIGKNKAFVGLIRMMSLFNHNRISGKILSKYDLGVWSSLEDILKETYLIVGRKRRYNINTSIYTG